MNEDALDTIWGNEAGIMISVYKESNGQIRLN